MITAEDDREQRARSVSALRLHAHD